MSAPPFRPTTLARDARALRLAKARRILVRRLASPVFTAARASPTVRTNSLIDPFCQAKTCSMAACTSGFAALALAMRSGMGLPLSFLRWILDRSRAFRRRFSFVSGRKAFGGKTIHWIVFFSASPAQTPLPVLVLSRRPHAAADCPAPVMSFTWLRSHSEKFRC